MSTPITPTSNDLRRTAVRVTAQDFSDTEKAQARENIGAITTDEVDLAQATGVLAVANGGTGTSGGFWDDFNRANTAAGSLGTPPGGETYDIRSTTGSGGAFAIATGIQISSNTVINDRDETVYFGVQLSDAVASMGARVAYSSIDDGTYPHAVFIIKNFDTGDDGWLDGDWLHGVWDRNTENEFNLTWHRGSDSTFQPIGTIEMPEGVLRILANGEEVVFHSEIVGQTLTAFANGIRIGIIDHAKIAELNGRYVYWEKAPITADSANLTWHEIWANRGPATPLYQPYSPALDSLRSKIGTVLFGGVATTETSASMNSDVGVASAAARVTLPVGVWQIETCEIVGDTNIASAGSRTRVAFTVGSASFSQASVIRGYANNANAENAALSYAPSYSFDSDIIFGADQSQLVRRTCVCTVTAEGLLAIYSAQGTPTASDHKLYVGSYIKATKIEE